MMRSSGGYLERAFRVRLTANIGQIDRERTAWGDVGASAGRLFERRPGFPVCLEVAQMTDTEHWRGGGDPGFGHVRGWHIEAAHPQPVEVRGDGKRATDGAYGPIEGELPEPGSIARERAVAGGIDHGRRDRQVKSRPLLRQLRRCKVDGDPPPRELKAAVIDRDLDSLARFLEGAVTHPDDVESRQAIGNIGFHLDPDPVEAKHRPRQGPGQHSGRILHDFVYT